MRSAASSLLETRASVHGSLRQVAPIFGSSALAKPRACASTSLAPCACALLAVEEGAEILGDRLPDVPESTHALAVKLTRQGVLQRTTSSQRYRNQHPPSCGNMPDDIMRALFYYGYTSPNYPWAPQGHVWRQLHGETHLKRAGG